MQSVLQLSNLSTILAIDKTCPWTPSPATDTFLTWVLVLGAIAAGQGPRRAWFVTALGPALRQTDI